MGDTQARLPENADIISYDGENFLVPDYPIIPVIEGDGIGADIWKAAQKVFDSAVDKVFSGKKKAVWLPLQADRKENSPGYAADVITENIKKHKVCLIGPLEKDPLVFKSSLIENLGLYCSFRPIRFFKEVKGPMTIGRNFKIINFQNSLEDFTDKIEFKPDSEESMKLKVILENRKDIPERFKNKNVAYYIKPEDEDNFIRLVRSILNYAILNNASSVSLVHDGIALKETNQFLVKKAYDLVANEFSRNIIPSEDCGGNAPPGMILFRDIYTKDFLNGFPANPEKFNIVLSISLSGIHLSELIMSLAGTRSITPSAYVNNEKGTGIFEVTHGTLGKYAGFDKANPSSIILSGSLLFDYIGWREVARVIEEALIKTIGEKRVTYDYARNIDGAVELKCSEFADAIIKEISQ